MRRLAPAPEITLGDRAWAASLRLIDVETTGLTGPASVRLHYEHSATAATFVVRGDGVVEPEAPPEAWAICLADRGFQDGQVFEVLVRLMESVAARALSGASGTAIR